MCSFGANVESKSIIRTRKEKGGRKTGHLAHFGKKRARLKQSLRFHDLQIVGHREDARDAVSPQANQILVRVAVDDALER